MEKVQEASGVLAPYKWSYGGTRTKEAVRPKSLVRTFVCLPEKSNLKVPETLAENSELQSVGIGSKKITFSSKCIYIVSMDRDLILPETFAPKIESELCHEHVYSFNFKSHMDDHEK